MAIMKMVLKFCLALIILRLIFCKMLLHYGPIVALGAVGVYVSRFLQSNIESSIGSSVDPSSGLGTYNCNHQFTTEVVSLDPLMIYINNFLNPYEVEYLLDLG